ncbi:HRDC domain-containing protein [Thermodesulfobacteriota bacterium]
MTATATPRVQDDITQQLGIPDAQMHIHGFRRTNIAIEINEMLPSDRTLKVREILKEKKNLPAIIYAPTRQKTEDLANDLKDMIRVEPYHAGISPEIRDSVQTSFLAGELDAIVATIAFGMGIDKPDIRTVIHTAMPGSLEGYYQEIGRAGRDSKPSRAVFLQSYGDRQVHLFFHEKSYPDESRLNNIFKILKPDPVPLEKLRDSLDMEEEEFDNAVEKLWIHGGANVVSGDWIQKGHNRWNVSYNRQKSHRLEQIDEIARFANSYSCRMLYLINHFGDREDRGNSCGICDVCNPENSSTENTREPDLREQRIIGDIISLLKNAHSLGTGKLYSSTCPETSYPRSTFEGLLRSLVRSGLITLSDHNFDKNGDTIHYKRAELTHNGYSFNASEVNIVKIDSSIIAEKLKKKQHRLKKPKTTKTTKSALKGSTENPELHKTLRTWRNNLAKKRGIPAFRIFSNKVLSNLSSMLPTTEDELLMVNGVGPYFVERHGNEVINIIKDYLRKNEDK